MFEKTLARLLTSALGAYVDDLNAEQLRLGLFGGRLHLRNLRLRTSAFDALQLPIELVGGCIGELDITIPWTSLFSSTISVIVRDVCIVARPQWNLSRNRISEWDKLFKTAQLEAYEALKMQLRDALSNSSVADSGNSDTLLSSIIGRISISIESFHFRFEDPDPILGRYFCLGLQFSRLGISEPQQSDSSRSSEFNHIGLSLSDFCIYIDHSETKGDVILAPEVTSNSELLIDFMHVFNSHSKSSKSKLLEPKHFHLLAHMDFEMIFQMCINDDQSKFQFQQAPRSLHCVVPAVNCSVDQFQVGYLLSLNRKMSSFKAHVTTLSRIVLPLQSSSTSIVKQHWHVAIHSTIALLRKQSTDMSWTRIKNFRNDLRRYVPLYKSKLFALGSSVSSFDDSGLRELEATLNVQDILVMRAFAEYEVDLLSCLHRNFLHFFPQVEVQAPPVPPLTPSGLLQRVSSFMPFRNFIAGKHASSAPQDLSWQAESSTSIIAQMSNEDRAHYQSLADDENIYFQDPSIVEQKLQQVKDQSISIVKGFSPSDMFEQLPAETSSEHSMSRVALSKMMGVDAVLMAGSVQVNKVSFHLMMSNSVHLSDDLHHDIVHFEMKDIQLLGKQTISVSQFTAELGNCTLTDSSVGVEYSSSWPSRPFLHMFGPRGCAAPNPKWTKHWHDSASNALSKRRRDTVAVAARAASHGFGRDRRHVRESEDIIVEWRSAILQNEHVARIRHPFVSVQLEISTIDQPQTSISVNVAPFDVVLNLPVLLDCRQFMSLAQRMSPLPDDSIEVNVPHATHFPTFSHIGDFSRRVESKRQAAAALASHVHIDICLKSCALIVPFHSANPTCLPVDCRLDDDEQIFANALMQHSLAGSCLVVDVGAIRIQQRKKCSCGTFSLDGPVSSFADAFYSCVRPVHLVNIAASSSEKCADAASLCNEPLLNENEIAQFDDRRIDAEDVLASCPHVEDFYQSVVVSIPMIDMLLTPGWLLRDNSAQWRSMLDVEHTNAFDFQARDMHISGREQMKLLSVVGTLLRFQPNVLDGDDWLPEALVSLEFKSIGIQISSSSYQWSRLIADSLASFSPSVEVPPADHPIPDDISVQAAPNRNHHKFRAQLAVHSLSVTFHIDAPLAFVACRPVQPFDFVETNRRLFHVSNHLATFSLDLLCARAWKSFAGLQTAAQMGSVCLEYEAYPIGHPARYLLRAGSRNFIPSAAIAGLCTADQEPLGLHNFADLPTAISIHCFSWSEASMRHCNSSRSLPSDPFNVELNASSFEALPRSPLLSIRRNVSSDAAVWIPSHLIFGDLKKVAIDSICVHWQRDVFRSLQNIFLYDLTLLGKDPNPIQGVRAFSHISFETLLNTSCTSQWQSQLNSIFSALVSKIQSCEGKQEEIADASLVECFDSKSSRLCLAVRSFSLDFYRGVAHDLSPDTTLPPLPSMDSPHCLSAQGATKFDNILIRSWPLQPLFPSMPLHLSLAPPNTPPVQFSDIVCRALAKSLLNPEDFNWSWNWGLTSELPFARTAFNSFAFIYSADSKLNRAQVQLSDLTMTDLAANSRFPLVISRQDVTSLFCVDAAWVEPVTFSGVRQKFAAPVVPSPLRLLLPRTSLIVESSVYVVRASSLKVIMALPFFMQLKEYFANEVLLETGLPLLPSHGLLGPIAPDLTKLNVSFERIFAHIPHRAISPETAPAYTRLRSEPQSSQPWPGSGPIEWIILQFPKLDLSNSWFLQDCNSRIQIDQADITPAFIPCSQTDIRISNFLITRRTLQAAPVNFLDRTSLSISISVPIRAGLPLGVIVEPTALHHPLFDATFPLGFTEFTSKRVRAHMESIELDVSASEIELLRAFAATDVSFMLGIPPSKSSSSPIDDVHKPRPHDSNAHFVSECACKVRDIDMQFQVSNFCLQLFASQCGQLHVATSNQNLLVDDQTVDDTCFDMLDISSRLAGVDLFNDAATAKPSPGNSNNNVASTEVDISSQQCIEGPWLLRSMTERRTGSRLQMLFCLDVHNVNINLIQQINRSVQIYVGHPSNSSGKSHIFKFHGINVRTSNTDLTVQDLNFECRHHILLDHFQSMLSCRGDHDQKNGMRVHFCTESSQDSNDLLQKRESSSISVASTEFRVTFHTASVALLSHLLTAWAYIRSPQYLLNYYSFLHSDRPSSVASHSAAKELSFPNLHLKLQIGKFRLWIVQDRTLCMRQSVSGLTSESDLPALHQDMFRIPPSLLLHTSIDVELQRFTHHSRQWWDHQLCAKFVDSGLRLYFQTLPHLMQSDHDSVGVPLLLPLTTEFQARVHLPAFNHIMCSTAFNRPDFQCNVTLSLIDVCFTSKDVIACADIAQNVEWCLGRLKESIGKLKDYMNQQQPAPSVSCPSRVVAPPETPRRHVKAQQFLFSPGGVAHMSAPSTVNRRMAVPLAIPELEHVSSTSSSSRDAPSKLFGFDFGLFDALHGKFEFNCAGVRIVLMDDSNLERHSPSPLCNLSLQQCSVIVAGTSADSLHSFFVHPEFWSWGKCVAESLFDADFAPLDVGCSQHRILTLSVQAQIDIFNSRTRKFECVLEQSLISLCLSRVAYSDGLKVEVSVPTIVDLCLSDQILSEILSVSDALEMTTATCQRVASRDLATLATSLPAELYLCRLNNESGVRLRLNSKSNLSNSSDWGVSKAPKTRAEVPSWLHESHLPRTRRLHSDESGLYSKSENVAARRGFGTLSHAISTNLFSGLLQKQHSADRSSYVYLEPGHQILIESYSIAVGGDRRCILSSVDGHRLSKPLDTSILPFVIEFEPSPGHAWHAFPTLPLVPKQSSAIGTQTASKWFQGQSVLGSRDLFLDKISRHSITIHLRKDELSSNDSEYRMLLKIDQLNLSSSATLHFKSHLGVRNESAHSVHIRIKVKSNQKSQESAPEYHSFIIQPNQSCMIPSFLNKESRIRVTPHNLSVDRQLHYNFADIGCVDDWLNRFSPFEPKFVPCFPLPSRWKSVRARLPFTSSFPDLSKSEDVGDDAIGNDASTFNSSRLKSVWSSPDLRPLNNSVAEAMPALPAIELSQSESSRPSLENEQDSFDRACWYSVFCRPGDPDEASYSDQINSAVQNDESQQCPRMITITAPLTLVNTLPQKCNIVISTQHVQAAPVQYQSLASSNVIGLPRLEALSTTSFNTIPLHGRMEVAESDSDDEFVDDRDVFASNGLVVDPLDLRNVRIDLQRDEFKSSGSGSEPMIALLLGLDSGQSYRCHFLPPHCRKWWRVQLLPNFKSWSRAVLLETGVCLSGSSARSPLPGSSTAELGIHQFTSSSAPTTPPVILSPVFRRNFPQSPSSPAVHSPIDQSDLFHQRSSSHFSFSGLHSSTVDNDVNSAIQAVETNSGFSYFLRFCAGLTDSDRQLLIARSTHVFDRKMDSLEIIFDHCSTLQCADDQNPAMHAFSDSTHPHLVALFVPFWIRNHTLMPLQFGFSQSARSVQAALSAAAASQAAKIAAQKQAWLKDRVLNAFVGGAPIDEGRDEPIKLGGISLVAGQDDVDDDFFNEKGSFQPTRTGMQSSHRPGLGALLSTTKKRRPNNLDLQLESELSTKSDVIMFSPFNESMHSPFSESNRRKLSVREGSNLESLRIRKVGLSALVSNPHDIWSWVSPLPSDTAESDRSSWGFKVVDTSASNRSIVLSAKVSTAETVFWRTNMLDVMSRIMVLNATNIDIEIGQSIEQSPISTSFTFAPADHKPCVLSADQNTNQINFSCKLSGINCMWSGIVSVETILQQSQIIRLNRILNSDSTPGVIDHVSHLPWYVNFVDHGLRSENLISQVESIFLRLEATLIDGIIHISIVDDRIYKTPGLGGAPIEIRNFSQVPIYFCQSMHGAQQSSSSVGISTSQLSSLYSWISFNNDDNLRTNAPKSQWITQPESEFAGLQLQCLLPQQSCGFAWDRPCDIHEVVFALVAGKLSEQQHPATIPVKSQMLMLGSYAADQISSYPSIDIPWMSKSFGSSIRIEVFVENGNYIMQVLPGSGYSASTSLMSSNSVSSASHSKDTFQVSADFAGFGLSVIETSAASNSPDFSNPHTFSRELLYLSATGLNIKVDSDFHRSQVASRREEYLLTMHSFQIDDQLSGTVHPVVLGRTHRTLANIGHSIAHHAATHSLFEADTPDGSTPDGMDEWPDDSDSDESVASLTDTSSQLHPGYVSEAHETGSNSRPKSLLDRAFQHRTSVAHSRFIESVRKSDSEPALASPMIFVKITRESPSTAPHSSLVMSTPTPTATDDGNLDVENDHTRTHLIRSHHVAPMNSARPIAIKSIEVQLAEIDMNFDEPFLLGLYRFYMKSSRAQLGDKGVNSSNSDSSAQPAKLIHHQLADESLLPKLNSPFSKLPAELRSIIFRPTPSFPLIQSLVIGEMLFNLSFSASPPVAQSVDRSETSLSVPAPAADVPEVDYMSWWPLPAWLHEVGATLFQLHRAPIKVCTLNVLDLHVISPSQPRVVRLFEETSPFRRQLPANITAPLFTSPLKPVIDFYVEQASGQVILALGESNPLLGDPGAFAKSLRDGWDHLHRQRQQDGSTVSGIKHFAQLTVFGAASSARLIANSIAEGLQRLDSQATGFATQVASPPRTKARSNALVSPNGASSKFSFDWLREMLHLPARQRNTDGSTSAASPAIRQISEPGSASVITALSLDQSAVTLADTNHDGVWSVASGSVRGFNSILFGPFLGFQVIGLPTVLKTTRYPAHIALQMGSDVARTVARGADTVREWYQPSQQIVQLRRIRAPRVFAGGLRVIPYDSVPPLLLSLFDEYLAERRRMLANPERRPTDMLSTNTGMPSRIHARSVHSSSIRDHECYLTHCISLTHGRALIFTSRAMLVVRLPQTQRARASSIRAAESRVEHATSSTGSDSKHASRSGLSRLVKPETAAQAASVEFKLPHAHSSYSEAALLQPLCPGAWRKLLMERVPLECITRVDVDGHSVRLSVTAPGASATKDSKGLGPLSLGLTALASVTFDAVRTVELLDCTIDPLSILQSVFPHSIVMSAAAVEASARSAAQQHAHSLQMQRISQAQSQVAARRTAPPPKTVKRAAVAASPVVSTSSVEAGASALESVFATPLVRRPSGGALRRVSMQRQQRNQSPSSSGAATPSLPSE